MALQAHASEWVEELHELKRAAEAARRGAGKTADDHSRVLPVDPAASPSDPQSVKAAAVALQFGEPPGGCHLSYVMRGVGLAELSKRFGKQFR